jgi:hypothetical protein
MVKESNRDIEFESIQREEHNIRNLQRIHVLVRTWTQVRNK